MRARLVVLIALAALLCGLISTSPAQAARANVVPNDLPDWSAGALVSSASSGYFAIGTKVGIHSGTQVVLSGLPAWSSSYRVVNFTAEATGSQQGTTGTDEAYIRISLQDTTHPGVVPFLDILVMSGEVTVITLPYSLDLTAQGNAIDFTPGDTMRLVADVTDIVVPVHSGLYDLSFHSLVARQ